MGRTSISLALLISLGFTAFFIWGSTTFSTLTQDLPSLETIAQLLEPPDGLLLEPTRFFDRSGEIILLELENPAINARKYLPMQGASSSAEALHPYFAIATLVVSDPTFLEYPGLLSAVVTPQGNRSLSQRLVSDLLLWDEPESLWRIWRERILAAQLTYHYGHEKILTWFLNSTYYGNQAYGVDAAAQVYFGKSATELNLAEITMIAAIADEPTINPINNLESAIKRQQAAIDLMLTAGKISKDEAYQAKETELIFKPPAPPRPNPAPAFTQLAWDQVIKEIPIERLERGGFEIITTLDYDLQTQAACTAEVHLTRLMGSTVQGASPNCQAVRFLPTLSFDTTITPPELNTNIMVLDPHSGQILAAVGKSTGDLIPTQKSGHPPGTLMTPFIYLTAFTRGFSPASLVWDMPSSFPETITQKTNPIGSFNGPLRVRTAVNNDIWLPALSTLNQIGPENVWHTAEKFGISITPEDKATPECPSCLYTLEGGEVTLQSIMGAFGILANQGKFTGSVTNIDYELPELSAISIIEIKDSQGNVLPHDNAPKNQPVISSQLAYLMTDMLSDEPARWPSLGHPNPLEIGRPAAAKMGATTQGDDIWAVGYTPQLVVGVWIGTGDTGETDQIAVPSKAAAALWNGIIKYASRDLPVEDWEKPPGIVTTEVCDPSGLLPTRDCPLIVSEVFLSGHEPTQLDTLYRAYQVNRETGRLATIFTPPELIEERVYLIVPPEAIVWAQESGFPVPPQSYDAILVPNPPAHARITAPAMFSAVSGEIAIEGSANGDDFISYRLQVGEGLNPQSWFVVGNDTSTPVDHDVLGKWDTSLLNGLYAVQLIIVRENQQVDTTTIQVTVDNQAPNTTINYPEDGQMFSLETDSIITFQVQATDNLQLEKIEFYIDGRLTATQTQPPFALPWSVLAGNHRLRVKATDLAGNTHQSKVVFTVE
ncbi:MAG: transglycosylase domain-containing protein [Chloroflexota bacterium]